MYTTIIVMQMKSYTNIKYQKVLYMHMHTYIRTHIHYMYIIYTCMCVCVYIYKHLSSYLLGGNGTKD